MTEGEDAGHTPGHRRRAAPPLGATACPCSSRACRPDAGPRRDLQQKMRRPDVDVELGDGGDGIGKGRGGRLVVDDDDVPDFAVVFASVPFSSSFDDDFDSDVSVVVLGRTFSSRAARSLW